jgi:hypothetical protein
MDAETSALIDAIAHLVSAIVWPALLLFVVVSFRQPLHEFLANLGELGRVSWIRAVGEQSPGRMRRKAEEEPIPVFVWATTRTQRCAARVARSRP